MELLKSITLTLQELSIIKKGFDAKIYNMIQDFLYQPTSLIHGLFGGNLNVQTSPLTICITIPLFMMLISIIIVGILPAIFNCNNRFGRGSEYAYEMMEDLKQTLTPFLNSTYVNGHFNYVLSTMPLSVISVGGMVYFNTLDANGTLKLENQHSLIFERHGVKTENIVNSSALKMMNAPLNSIADYNIYVLNISKRVHCDLKEVTQIDEHNILVVGTDSAQLLKTVVELIDKSPISISPDDSIEVMNQLSNL